LRFGVSADPLRSDHRHFSSQLYNNLDQCGVVYPIWSRFEAAFCVQSRRGGTFPIQSSNGFPAVVARLAASANASARQWTEASAKPWRSRDRATRIARASRAMTAGGGIDFST